MMTDESEATMSTEERLENLESKLTQQKRRYHRLLAGLLAVFIGAVVVVMADRPLPRCAAQAPAARKDIPDVIRARSFAVVDEKGNRRAALGVLKDGPLLTLYDEKDQARVALAVGKNVAGLVMLDENCMPRIMLNVDKDGARLGLLDENERTIWSAP